MCRDPEAFKQLCNDYKKAVVLANGGVVDRAPRGAISARFGPEPDLSSEADQ